MCKVIGQWTSYYIKLAYKVVTKLISLHQPVSTEATLLIRNSVEIDNKGYTKIENMRESGNKFSR